MNLTIAKVKVMNINLNKIVFNLSMLHVIRQVESIFLFYKIFV